MKKRALLLLTVILLALPALSLATTITMTFAGDCTLGADAPYFANEKAYPALIEKYGYGYPFKNMLPLFENDDLTMINFEGVLQDSEKGQRKGLPYHFRGPEAYAAILNEASIESVNLGNNHSNDYGAKGLLSTKEALTAHGVGFCVDRDIYYFEKDGVKVAVLGFFKANFNLNRNWVKDAIPALRDEGVDFVVVHLHSGDEYSLKHSRVSQSIARRLIDLGADLVIGHHPHVIQGIEVYKNRTILYSLGNFSFGGTRSAKKPTLPTMVARFEIVFDGETYQSQQLTIHPAYCVGEGAEQNYQPRLVTGTEAETVMKQIQKDTPFTLNPFVEGQGAVQAPIYAR